MRLKLLYIIVFAIIIVSAVFAATGLLTTFYSQPNPFEINFTGAENQTYYIDVPRYVYVTNITLNLEGYLAK